jgi:hypothetical protein
LRNDGFNGEGTHCVRFYPNVPSRRAATLVGDAIVIGLLLVFAWLGLVVHDAVDRLGALGEGVQATGGAVSSGFETAAEAVDGTPVVGGELADGLREAGESSGGEVTDLGERGEQGAHRLADLLGLLTFALPAGFLLLFYLPPRIELAQRVTAAARVLTEPDSDERRRVVAMRAAFALPYGTLLHYTQDPLGDLAAGRYDRLVEAAFDDAGLRPPKG